jgi:protein transport protein SEC24
VSLDRYTAGNVYYYPAYHPDRDGDKFSRELSDLLTRPTGFEAVMRVRVTKGLKVTSQPPPPHTHAI